MTKTVTFAGLNPPNFLFDFLRVRLTFEGADSPTAIYDTAPNGDEHVWTVGGNANIDTTLPLMGFGSLLCDGTGDYVTTPAHADFILGSGDFTIHVRFQCTAAGGTQQNICGQGDSSATSSTLPFRIQRTTANVLFARIGDSLGGTHTITGTTVIDSNTHHAALVRRGDEIKLFMDGVQEGPTLPFTGTVFANGTNNLSVGRMGELTTGTFTGRIDEFYMFVGVSLWWESGFTVPDETLSAFSIFFWAKDALYLPRLNIETDAIPSIQSVAISPGTVSLGKDLGTRSTVTINLNDHRHIFASEDFSSGTFFSKFRARYGLTLRGQTMIVLQGSLEQLETDLATLTGLERRHYIVESCEGPAPGNGTYQFVLKDILKLADGDRAQAPVPSNGFLVADITNVAGTATLSPTGIGDEEYPASGYANIGGSEIVGFTRSGDVLTITRAQFNTTAQAHSAQDRVQLCLEYDGEDVADIIYDLLTTYANVSTGYITLANWQAETAAFLGTLYTALIAEPTSVNQLVSELIEQAALAIWWDDAAAQIRLQVLREIGTDVLTYDDDNVMEKTLTSKEQPDQRISQVYTYFGKINPLVSDDQLNNYRSTAFTQDADADVAYGSPAIKKILSRWIPSGGRSVAEVLNNKLLGRFVDPPRRFQFDVMRFSGVDPVLGNGYKLRSWCFTDTIGNPVDVPIQLTKISTLEDRFQIEGEEMLWTPYGADIDPGTRSIIFDGNENDVDLLERHNQLYPEAESGDVISVIIYSGVIIGSSSEATPAFDVGGPWPGGVTINISVLGKIQGHGGTGGASEPGFGGATPGSPGVTGGTAFYSRQAVTVTGTGQVWGGGGGGGGSAQGGGGGGGGAGVLPGTGGSGTPGGSTGSEFTGGAGGPGSGGLNGGLGGAPGQSGFSGASFPALGVPGGAGGAAGTGVDGASFINGGAGITTADVRGGQIN